MTIDDYIDTYKSYANDYEKGRYEMGWSSQQRDYAIGRAREYRQLVEWLEELKAYKGSVDCPNIYKLGIQDGVVSGIEQGRAEAIKQIKSNSRMIVEKNGKISYWISEENFNEIEQMKEPKE